jgi:4,5-DOPA dioxygenase extradiol
MKRGEFLKMLAITPLALTSMKLNDLNTIAGSFPATEKMPVLFVGHGSPMNALEDNAFTRSLKKAGQDLRKRQQPNAILVVSAHWLTKGSFVNISPKPETIHDFGGFPKELFAQQYPAPGSPEIAKEVTKLSPLVHETEEWGLDHGAWTILIHLFPEADIPVFELSIDYHQPLDYHLNLARQLQALRNKGVLIIGSGNIVHNLRQSMPRFAAGDASPYDWAVEFDSWVKDKLDKRDYKSLTNYLDAGEAGNMSVPTPDHYIPLLYSVGFAGEKEPLTQIHEDVIFGGISMRTFWIG